LINFYNICDNKHEYQNNYVNNLLSNYEIKKNK